MATNSLPSATTSPVLRVATKVTLHDTGRQRRRELGTEEVYSPVTQRMPQDRSGRRVNWSAAARAYAPGATVDCDAMWEDYRPTLRTQRQAGGRLAGVPATRSLA